MNYNTNQSIFIQIAERICDRVLSGNYKADSRIPSVRELAVEMEVNPNTVMRSFERLQANDIIYNKRGIGYFVASDAEQKIREMRHNQFVEEVMHARSCQEPELQKVRAELDQAYREINARLGQQDQETLLQLADLENELREETS